MGNRQRIIGFLALFSALFLIGQFFFVPKTYVNSKIISALQAPKIFFQSFLNRHKIITQMSDLALENQSLRAQLLEASLAPERLDVEGKTYISTKVYSQYPFNNVDKLLVNVGKEEGIKIGDVAVISPGIFLGQVISVFDHTSEVRTVFDPNWELAVKIGSKATDSLLIGGHDPDLKLISKNASLVSGDEVYLASEQFPFGLTIGQVDKVKLQERDLFDEATLSTPYERTNIQTIFIIYEE